MNKYKANIKITLREGILDVQGKTVEHALHSIGFETMSAVRIGKFVTLEIKAESETAAQHQIENACKQIIANPIIEDYSIEITKAE
jgi:phosphoribosylformylglycinamidine synthase subunit PurS